MVPLYLFLHTKNKYSHRFLSFSYSLMIMQKTIFQHGSSFSLSRTLGLYAFPRASCYVHMLAMRRDLLLERGGTPYVMGSPI